MDDYFGFLGGGWLGHGWDGIDLPFGLAACEMDLCAPLIPPPRNIYVRLDELVSTARSWWTAGRQGSVCLSGAAAEAGEAVMR
jgi:hypothetical protein